MAVLEPAFRAMSSKTQYSNFSPGLRPNTSRFPLLALRSTAEFEDPVARTISRDGYTDTPNKLFRRNCAMPHFNRRCFCRKEGNGYRCRAPFGSDGVQSLPRHRRGGAQDSAWHESDSVRAVPFFVLVSSLMNCHNVWCFISPERNDGIISIS